MSVLILDLPPRLRGAAADDSTPAAAAGEWSYTWSADGLQPTRSGRAAASLLPRADSVVALLAPQDVAWHRITLPRAPAARMRAALAGLLEDALLDEPQDVHLALPPKAVAGEPTWVAAVQREWLAGVLAELQGAGLEVDRVAPALWPDELPRGRFRVDPRGDGDPALALDLADAQGVRTIGLQGSLARRLLPADPAGLRFVAEPAAAAAAERWLGSAVVVRSGAEQALDALQGPWNLRQFELLPRMRGTRWLRSAGRRLLGREWRAVRWGLAGLAAVHLAGLNAWAWQLSREIDTRREAAVQLLKASHPQVRVVLDAPVQMERETERLRAAAGRVGPADLEALLAAAATAWPDGQAPLQTLRYEAGQLSLSAPGLGMDRLGVLRERLRANGVDARWSEGQVVLSRGEGRPAR